MNERIDRRRFVQGTGVVIAAGLAGCLGGDDDDGDDSSNHDDHGHDDNDDNDDNDDHDHGEYTFTHINLILLVNEHGVVERSYPRGAMVDTSKVLEDVRAVTGN